MKKRFDGGPRPGKHGYYIVGGIPWSQTWYQEARNKDGTPKKDEAGNQLLQWGGHMCGSDWGYYGPFRNERRAVEWFQKNAIQGKPMSFDPWFVIKRYVVDGQKTVFSKEELRQIEEGSVEFTEHVRKLKKPRKTRVREGLWSANEELPLRVTVRTRVPRGFPKVSMRFVKPAKVRGVPRGAKFVK